MRRGCAKTDNGGMYPNSFDVNIPVCMGLALEVDPVPGSIA